jgi:hypothetical protein
MAGRKSTLILMLLLLVAFTLAFLLKVRQEMVDFEVNYKAAQRLRLGETLYRPSDGHYQFKYMPFSAFLYLPVTFLPLTGAKAVWYTVILLSTGLIFFLSSKLLSLDKTEALLIGLTSFLVLGRYFLRELQLGQINALITFLLLLAIRFQASPGRPRGKESGSGLSWGLATALKPYAAVFFPYLLLLRKWLALASGAAVLILAGLAPSLFYGFLGNLRVLNEWQSSLRASTPSLFSSQDNISLIALFTKWTGRGRVALVLYLAALAVLASLVLYLIKRRNECVQPVVLEGTLLLALIPLISPLGWDYTLLSWAPAVMLILKFFPRYRPLWKGVLCLNLLVVALSLYDIMGRDFYAAFMSKSIITMNFVVLVAYLVYLRIKRYA